MRQTRKKKARRRRDFLYKKLFYYVARLLYHWKLINRFFLTSLHAIHNNKIYEHKAFFHFQSPRTRADEDKAFSQTFSSTPTSKEPTKFCKSSVSARKLSVARAISFKLDVVSMSEADICSTLLAICSAPADCSCNETDETAIIASTSSDPRTIPAKDSPAFRANSNPASVSASCGSERASLSATADKSRTFAVSLGAAAHALREAKRQARNEKK